MTAILSMASQMSGRNMRQSFMTRPTLHRAADDRSHLRLTYADVELGGHALLDRGHGAKRLAQLNAHQRAQLLGADEVIGLAALAQPSHLVLEAEVVDQLERVAQGVA